MKLLGHAQPADNTEEVITRNKVKEWEASIAKESKLKAFRRLARPNQKRIAAAPEFYFISDLVQLCDLISIIGSFSLSSFVFPSQDPSHNK